MAPGKELPEGRHQYIFLTKASDRTEVKRMVTGYCRLNGESFPLCDLDWVLCQGRPNLDKDPERLIVGDPKSFVGVFSGQQLQEKKVKFWICFPARIIAPNIHCTVCLATPKTCRARLRV